MKLISNMVNQMDKENKQRKKEELLDKIYANKISSIIKTDNTLKYEEFILL